MANMDISELGILDFEECETIVALIGCVDNGDNYMLMTCFEDNLSGPDDDTTNDMAYAVATEYSDD